uniref:Uncharacterized protein n=1 Tax=Anguilla anguilla TaxID=7936 RepID=A0A0E9SJV8_ANGAN
MQHFNMPLQKCNGSTGCGQSQNRLAENPTPRPYCILAPMAVPIHGP